MPAPDPSVKSDLAPRYRAAMWILGVFTLGIAALSMWSQSRRWPRRATAAGLELRSGRVVPWQAIRVVRQVRERVTMVAGANQSGTTFEAGTWLQLLTDDAEVQIIPHLLTRGGDMVAFVLEHVPAEAF